MGKDRREWRKLVKKLRRSRIRRLHAEKADWTKQTGPEKDKGFDESIEEDEGELDLEEQRLHDLEEEAWLERERQSTITFKARMEKQEELANLLAAEKERIRKQLEEKQAIALEQQKALERVQKEIKAKKVEEFNQLLEFLSGDVSSPPLTYMMAESGETSDVPCLYFVRTGACRFYQRCRNPHPSPALSTTILIANFFSHAALEQNPTDDSDVSLEYEDSDLRKEFLSFYDDVLPEFQNYGTVVQFKVCRNFEPHLRGNVYVQYENIRDSVNAYQTFNGRYYNGKQLTLRFVKLSSWRNAICGQFNRGICLKGKACNYLHVFRNPTREFVSADRDWKNPTPFSISNDEPGRFSNSSHDQTPSGPSKSISNSISRKGSVAYHNLTLSRRSDSKRECVESHRESRIRPKSAFQGSRKRNRSRSKSRERKKCKRRKREASSSYKTRSQSRHKSKPKKSSSKKHKKKKSRKCLG